jgi:DNA topoisomerase IA
MFVSKVAEALYQRGIISYPRTETDFFKEGTSINMSTNVYAIVDMKNNYNRD